MITNRLAAALLTVSAVLPACSSIPLSSLPALSQIDPQTTDIRYLRVAMDLPIGLRPRPGGVIMEADVKAAGTPDRSIPFRLETIEPRSSGSMANIPLESGRQRFLFRMAPMDVPAFDALRSGLFVLRDKGVSGSLGLGIKSKEFCRDGAIPAGPLLSTTYLRTSETKSFVVVTRDLDLKTQADVATELATLEDCQ
jgi:hypothetical protein